MNKYRNRKTVVDGITFDSKREANRYCELKLLEIGGCIQNLERQKRFELIAKSEHGRAIYYVADFVYTQDGEMVVEDVKGVRTGVYILKKRMMAEHNQIIVKEV